MTTNVVMMLWFMARSHNKDILNNVIIERKTLNDSCHTHA